MHNGPARRMAKPTPIQQKHVVCLVEWRGGSTHCLQEDLQATMDANVERRPRSRRVVVDALPAELEARRLALHGQPAQKP